MRRDQAFLADRIDAAEQAQRLVGEASVEDLSRRGPGPLVVDRPALSTLSCSLR